MNVRDAFYLTRQHKPIGTFLLLAPTAWALLIAANGEPDWTINLIFIAGVWLMRSAGCIINDYADRHLDGHVARTKDRPLAAGRITPRAALTLSAILVGLAALLTLPLGIKVMAFAAAGLGITILYPFLKRITYWPQLMLGAAFSWGVPMAFVAYQGATNLPAWPMFALSFVWIVAFDTQYALTDIVDDVTVGIKSSAIGLGNHVQTGIVALQALFLSGWVAAGTSHAAGALFWAAIILCAALFAYQYRLVQQDQPLAAFQNNAWVGLAIFIGLLNF